MFSMPSEKMAVRFGVLSLLAGASAMQCFPDGIPETETHHNVLRKTVQFRHGAGAEERL